jgi:HEAT repeat protein
VTDDHASQLLHQLAELSPMPSDDDPDLTSERLDAYVDVLTEIGHLFEHGVDPRFIRPLIHSFGYGDGYEVYWDTVSLLEQFPHEIVRPALHEALRSSERGARKWAAHILGRARDPHDVMALVSALQDPEWEVRYNALQALSMIGDKSAQAAMERLFEDPVEEVRRAARRYVEALLDQRYAIKND